MNLTPNFSKISKIFPGLNKPWAEYLDAVPGGDEREKRFNQLLAVNFLLGDLESGETTRARFFRDTDEWLEISDPMSSFEEIARTHIARNPTEPNIRYLKTLDKENPIGISSSLFEILIRMGIRMKLPKRGAQRKVPHPKWLKGFARIIAKDIRKDNPEMSESKIAGIVNKELKSINPRLGTPDDVIKKMIKDGRSKI